MAKLLGMQVDACMIDLDGTLVDTMGDFDAVVAQMLQVLKLPALPRSELQGMVGKSFLIFSRCNAPCRNQNNRPARHKTAATPDAAPP